MVLTPFWYDFLINVTPFSNDFRLQRYNKNCTYARRKGFFCKKVVFSLRFFWWLYRALMLAWRELYKRQKREGSALFAKKPFSLAYAPQDATVLSKGTPFMGEEVEGTKKKWHTQARMSFFSFTRDYSSSFLAAFLVAFLAGAASASMEALRSASTERSPRVVFSTFGISTCGSSALAAFLAALAGASLRSSQVRRCETRIRFASRLKISRHRV